MVAPEVVTGQGSRGSSQEHPTQAGRAPSRGFSSQAREVRRREGLQLAVVSCVPSVAFNGTFAIEVAAVDVAAVKYAYILKP